MSERAAKGRLTLQAHVDARLRFVRPTPTDKRQKSSQQTAPQHFVADYHTLPGAACEAVGVADANG